VRCPTKPASPGSASTSYVASTGALSLKTLILNVVKGSGSGCIATVTFCVPPSIVKCEPSILKPSAVTEIRYLPAGRSGSDVASLRSVWSPWATMGAMPDVDRVDGHWQVSA
jgi:hypothetical protein